MINQQQCMCVLLTHTLAYTGCRVSTQALFGAYGSECVVTEFDLIPTPS